MSSPGVAVADLVMAYFLVVVRLKAVAVAVST